MPLPISWPWRRMPCCCTLLNKAASSQMDFHHIWYSFLILNQFFPPIPLQEVVSDERLQGGQLLEEPKLLHFRGNTFSLQISVLDIPPFLWRIKPFTACQVLVHFTCLNSEAVRVFHCCWHNVLFSFERSGFNLWSMQQTPCCLMILMSRFAA